jgi:UDP:flavonoid glycosyltransferase YjiC (YdhE family)
VSTSIPAELGPLPSHVVVKRFVAQREVLADCFALVSHAGSGTVLNALEHGLPQVCLPVGADQVFNARRCADLGSGIVLSADTGTHDDIIQAVKDVLAVTGYRPCGRAAAGRDPRPARSRHGHVCAGITVRSIGCMTTPTPTAEA